MPLEKDFQNILKEIMRVKNQPIERAFIHWYIDVQFGDVDKIITDGPSDGGIDAIVRPKHVGGGKLVYILQSKYTNNVFKKRSPGTLNATCYKDFDALPPILDSDKEFEEWLESVDSSLKIDYKQLRKDYLNENNIIEWQLITLHSRSRKGENKLQNLTQDSFIYGSSIIKLFKLEQEGVTPPGDPLILNFTESMTIEDPYSGYKSYVLAANLDDFVDYLDNDPDKKLFARNVRLDLHSKINKNIEKTYVKSPKEFWYSHNGITVICSNATITGKSIRLLNPSVINGSQTLNSLSGVNKNKRHRNAKVLTRVLVVAGKAEKKAKPLQKNFVDEIIFRTNQQNKMYSYDLRANDIQQVKLAKYFMQNKVFYERRRGEWKLRRRAFRNEGIEKTHSVEIAQILAAFNFKIGVAKAKKGKEILFEDNYQELFYSPFEEIYLSFRIYKYSTFIVRNMSLRKTTSRMRTHTLLSVGSIFYAILYNSKYYKRLLNMPNTLNTINANDSNLIKLDKIIEKIFNDCWLSWRKVNKKDPTLSPNNFFKSEKWNVLLHKRLVKKYLRSGNVALRFAVK